MDFTPNSVVLSRDAFGNTDKKRYITILSVFYRFCFKKFNN